MLVECGFVRAQAHDGSEVTFTPSLGRIAALGSPREIVELYAELHGTGAERAAACVLHALCDQGDEDAPAKLIGYHDLNATAARVPWVPGSMPPAEQVIIARHLMRHGIVGTADPGKAGSGEYAAEFVASEYIAAARVHLGLSAAEAEALSMTEFQQLLAMKYPEQGAAAKPLPTAEEYEAAMRALDEAQGNG